MGDQIARVVEGSPEAQIVAMATFFFSMPTEEYPEALLVMPGEGEDWRMVEAIEEWNDLGDQQFLPLIVAGESPEPITIEQLRSLGLKPEHDSYLINQGYAQHTKSQTDWLVTQMRAKGIKSAHLYVSPYHQLRAYCTLLKSMLSSDGPWIKLYPARMKVSPFEEIPASQVSSWDLVAGEIERLRRYQEKGDVASYDEFVGYLRFLWGQP
jgi:hypothetical protein